MRKEQIEIGKRYAAKWYDRTIIVRIESECPRGGWNAINIQECRQLRIYTAAELLHEIGAGHVE